ncbi:MAG: EAL domain-containing protein [Gammaproteobacteria bacterium]
MNHPFSLIPRDLIRATDQGAVGQFDALGQRLAFSSHYQPIVSPALMRSVGAEALLRVAGSQGPLPTQEFFDRLPDTQSAEACRLARALHVLNAPPPRNGNDWLFLNVHPESIRQRRLTAERVVAELGALGVAPSRIVLEVLERAGLADEELRDFVREYRAAGFRIAIDDFGAGASNYDRVISMQPDIIKLDRSLIANAAATPRARRMFPHVVALLREAGSLVLVEGIETAEQAHIAIDADAELLQGWYFAEPAAGAPDEAACRQKIEAVMGVTPNHAAPKRNDADRFRGKFMDVWSAFREGKPIELIAQDIAEPQITRIYAIDNRGYQIGDTALTRSAIQGSPHPLANARGACWARRHYFRRAMEQPGRVQSTRPYLSLTEQQLCVTWSCATVHSSHGQCVICMDVLVEGARG